MSTDTSRPDAVDKGEPIVEVTDLVRVFGDRTVLNGVSFKIYKGETLVIMGGSGCGKSTLLRHVIGSLKSTSGSIKLFGEEITDMNEFELNKIRKRFGMNFQFGALMQSLTVGENVALPLVEHSEVDPSIIDLVVKMKLELVGLTGFENLMPSEISGGMKKRVGLARAVALDPELLFSDEPTSGLDPVMTAVIDELTLNLTQNMGMTAMIVSHDMASCFRIATHMLMLGTGELQGKVVAYGTPDEIRKDPNAYLQQFIKGEADGPIPLKLSKNEYIKRLVGE